MESWCFDSLDKEYVSNETITPSGSVIRSKDVLIGWDFKAPFSYEDSMLVPSQSVENSGFPEVGLSEIISKQCPPDSPKNVFYTDATVGDIVSPSVVSSDPVSVEEGSSSKVSSSVVDSNSRESSLIDLKLGGFGDNLNCNSSRAAPSSAESSTPAKRGRGTSFGSQTAYCQVYGCKKDLSSAKDYHKRHKVCDVHSKTSKVIVNGIDQRFCQQCSRFHLLGEFDDGKRSCRKRLAGHNERRRKPQVGYYSGRAGRSFSYTGSIGSKFQQTGTPLTTASFICQDILPRGTSHAEKSATSGWGTYVKTEDGIDYSQKLSNMYTNGQHQESSVISPLLLGNQYSSVNNTSSNRSQSLLGENVSQIPRELVSRSLVQTNPLGSQDFTLFDAASTVQGLPGISESGCALSLLSSQSQNSSVHPSGIAGAHTFNMPNRSPHYSVSEVSEKLLGVGSQGMTSGNQNRYPLCRNNDAAMPVLSNGDAANSSFSNGILQGSDFVNGNNQLFSEDGTTINLLQLSSQLQRVESQRQPVTGKQDPAIFGSLRMM